MPAVQKEAIAGAAVEQIALFRRELTAPAACYSAPPVPLRFRRRKEER